jgi:endonuclease-8
MSEGPQVRRVTEWLEHQLAGKRLLDWSTSRSEFSQVELRDRKLTEVFCKGKHIFLEIEGDLFIHNHLLMRGRWTKLDGQLLFPPAHAWLTLFVGPYTVCNLRGQMLRIAGRDEVLKELSRLGPDAMARPYPRRAIEISLRESALPIAESLLDQGLVSGIGNIAKSEILFAAEIAPQQNATELDGGRMERLLDAIHDTLWRSYHSGGRWDCSVYQKRGRPCPRCGKRIERIALSPSRRNTYFCPQCQD